MNEMKWMAKVSKLGWVGRGMEVSGAGTPASQSSLPEVSWAS